MARAYTPEKLDLLVAVARGEIEASPGRIHAIQGVLDHGNGKPATTIEVNGSLNAAPIASVIYLFGRPNRSGRHLRKMVKLPAVSLKLSDLDVTDKQSLSLGRRLH
jgi:hypothetical protein